MSAWLDAEGCFFNPQPTVSTVPLLNGQVCVVIDDALANPQGVVDWACTQTFETPRYPYPGLVHDLAGAMVLGVADCFAQYARSLLGARRTQELNVRLSLITTPPADLLPIQWMCHRDRFEIHRPETLFAAGVLYLFHDPALGGTSFYAPRQPAAATDKLVNDSQTLGAHEFGQRYGLQPSYITGSNAFFERIAMVPAAWNRLIFYDGGLFHSADVAQPARMLPDPRQGRLTLNSFITCRRAAA